MAWNIAFEKLPPPILLRGDEHIAYRDPTAVVADGWLHLFFALVETEPDGGVYMYLGKSKSRDLRYWTPVRKLTPRARHLNYSSPGNIIRYNGRWVLCLQTYCRENGEKYSNENCRIFAMGSHDLERWHWPGEDGAATTGCL